MSQRMQQPPEAGKGKEMYSPLEPLEGNVGLQMSTLILAQQDTFQTSKLQKYKIIHLN